MTPEEKNLLQSMVNDILGQFREAVAKGRGLKPEYVVTISDGRIFSGKQAKSLGLVDELGTIKDAINEAANQGGIKGKPNVYYIEKPKTLIERLFEDPSADSQDSPGGLFGLIKNAFALLSQIQEPHLVSETSIFLPGPYLLWGGVR